MTNKCELCGEPMPAGEEMFKFHGYSGNCPKPPLEKYEWDRLDKIKQDVRMLKMFTKEPLGEIELQRLDRIIECAQYLKNKGAK